LVSLLSYATNEPSCVIRDFGVLPNDFKYNDKIAHPNDDISGFPFALWIVGNLGAMKNKPSQAFLGAPRKIATAKVGFERLLLSLGKLSNASV
jgi:hypothetical protein